MPKVLLTLPLPQPAPQWLGDAAEVGVIGHIPSEPELATAVAEGVDVLCAQLRDPVTSRVLEAGKGRLRAVSLYAVGYNNVDMVAATSRGVIVTNTPGVLTDATADCAMGLLLACARRIVEGNTVMHTGHFEGWEPDYMLGLELKGATLGIIGMGRIGQAVARRARAFGMNIVYAGARKELPPDLADARPLPLEELLAASDVVSLHVPLAEDTYHMINARTLALMKRNAILVNTSRGPVVDEEDLVTALRENIIGGAGLDVYESEPRPAPGLIECENAVLTPHLGSATTQTRRAMAELCARNALSALAGELPKNTLNPRAWKKMPPPLIKPFPF